MWDSFKGFSKVYCIYIVSICWLFPTASVHFSTTLRCCKVVDLPFENPYCLLLRMLYSCGSLFCSRLWFPRPRNKCRLSLPVYSFQACFLYMALIFAVFKSSGKLPGWIDEVNIIIRAKLNFCQGSSKILGRILSGRGDLSVFKLLRAWSTSLLLFQSLPGAGLYYVVLIRDFLGVSLWWRLAKNFSSVWDFSKLVVAKLEFSVTRSRILFVVFTLHFT